MGDFASILRATLEGIPDALSEADRDLHQEVAEAARAVEQVSDGEVRLALRLADETPAAFDYTLQLDYQSRIHDLSRLSVPVRGYPILILSPGTKEQVGDLKNREQIRGYLEEMARDPDSALVQYLAFARRKNEK
jgi:hypothetical protein